MGQNERHDAGMPPRGNEMVTRRAMFEALEAGDDATAQKYVLDDAQHNGLRNYMAALQRYSSSVCTNAVVIDKLLSVPGLDKSSFAYKDSVAYAFMGVAANDAVLVGDQVTIADKLFDEIKNDQNAKDASLSLIFSAVISHGAAYPNAGLAKKLVEHGANLSEAFNIHNNRLLTQKRVIDNNLSDLLAFKARVMPAP